MKKIVLLVTFMIFAFTLSGCKPPTSLNPIDPIDGLCPTVERDLQDIDFTTNKVELNFLAQAAGDWDPDKDPTKALIENLTGYTVNYTQLPSAGATENLNLRLGAGDQFHAVKVTKNQYESLVQDCALLDLAPYIEKYATNMKDAISEESWQSVSIGDAVYGIPEAVSSENIDYTIAVRQDWLDELDLEVPTTKEEFKAMLVAFDEYYGVDSNGNPRSEFKALTFDQNQYVVSAISSAFSLYSEWQVVDGKVVSISENPALKDYLDYMKDLYNSGLVDDEVASNDFSTAMQKFARGNSGAIVMAWWNSIAVGDALEAGNQYGAELTYLEPLANENGERFIERGTGVPYITVIPAYMYEDAPYTINWLDSKLDEEIFKEIVIGEEGIHFTYKASEDAYFPGSKFNEKENSSWFLTGTREEDYAKYWQARVRKDDRMYESWYAINKNADLYGVYDPLAFAPSIEEYSTYANKLANETKAFVLPYIFTNESITFDQWVSKWKSLGGTELSQALNDWYQNK